MGTVKVLKREVNDFPSADMATEVVASIETGEIDKLCYTCRNEEIKYKCPACGVRTCSLACTKIHRNSTGRIEDGAAQ